MAIKHYKWLEGNDPPPIQQHSIAKHEVLREYLIAYIQTLAVLPARTELRLTLVDAFSGGGRYRHKDTGIEILGSPFVFLTAIKEAEFILKKHPHRHKPFNLDVSYIFLDKDKEAIKYLKNLLVERGFSDLLHSQKITLLNNQFNQEIATIINSIKNKSPRSGRSIFLLDQYGYKDVPTSHIRNILEKLPNSEIILTFATDALINFISEKPESQKILTELGIPSLLDGLSLSNVKHHKQWRLFIQSRLHQELVNQCGAKFFTTFFIRSPNGFGDYWLVHLSQHPKARDVMTEIHWKLQNHFVHFGDAGLDMFQILGYNPKKDNDFAGQDILPFEFDDIAQDRSVSTLMSQIPRLINQCDDVIRFGELFNSTCNYSPASSSIYKSTVIKLQDEKDLEILTCKGGKRRSADCIENSDIIRLPRQRAIYLG